MDYWGAKGYVNYWGEGAAHPHPPTPMVKKMLTVLCWSVKFVIIVWAEP